MSKLKRNVKKYVKENQPSYKGLSRAEKKAAQAKFEEEVELYRKELKRKLRKKHLLIGFVLCDGCLKVKLYRDFHSRKSKRYKRKELGRR